MPGQGPLFLARAVYRRRRLRDAARLLPVLGLVLFALPALGRGATQSGGDAVFLFLVWAGLIAAALVLAPHLVRSERDSDGPLPEGEAGAEPGAKGDKGAGGGR